MESFIIYIAKASGLLIVFFTAYYILLRKETFFTSNRGFLIAGLLTSALLPLAEYTKIIFIDPAPQVPAHPMQAVDIQQYMMMQQLMAATPEPFTINWYYVAIAIYSIGMLFFLTRFIADFISIRRLLKGKHIIKEQQFRLIDSDKVQSPFSFFNYIVYNSSVLQPEELENIISHEKVHSSQRHSIDMIVSQLFCIAFWFNPFAWLYKKSIVQNLEFIADAVAIKQLSDKISYQKTLLKITIQPECITITNHFYQSLIKKRIVMLNKNQSKRLNSLKYTLILPVLAAFMLTFQVKVVAQEKAPVVNNSAQEKTKISISVTKDSKDDELAAEAKVFKQEFDADVTFNNVTRNTSGEITAIKVTVKDKTQSQDHFVSGSTPIKPFTIELEKNNDSDDIAIAFGNPNNFHVTGDKIDVACTAKCTKAPKVMSFSASNTNDSIGYYTSGSNTANIYKDALVVINGVQQKNQDNDFNKVQLPTGQTIGFMKILSPKEAKKKYGKAGKKGAVEIETRSAPQPSNFVYSFDDDGDMTSTIKLGMPDMNQIMAMASNGVNIGMDALVNMEWNGMAFEDLSDEERKEIREEMKNARIEVQKAMKDVKIDFDREEYKRAFEKASKDSQWSEKDVEQAKAEMKQAQKELEKARKELEKVQKELEKTRAQNKKAK